jgi:hypothetical protein
MSKFKVQKHLSIIRKLFPKVERIVDASEPIRIEVTPRDQREAIKLDPQRCALAQAFRRQEHVDGVVISLSIAYLVRGNTATRYSVPHSISREITSFDRHKDFAAGEYQLSAPSRRYETTRKDHRSGPSGRSAAFRHYTGGVRAFPSIGGKQLRAD